MVESLMFPIIAGEEEKKKKAFKIKKRLYFNLQGQTKCTNTPGLEVVGEQAWPC